LSCWLLRKFRIFVHFGAKPDWGIGGTLVTVKFANRGTVAVDTRSARLSIVRVKPIAATRPAGD
jgi:hypothetical protein